MSSLKIENDTYGIESIVHQVICKFHQRSNAISEKKVAESPEYKGVGSALAEVKLRARAPPGLEDSPDLPENFHLC